MKPSAKHKAAKTKASKSSRAATAGKPPRRRWPAAVAAGGLLLLIFGWAVVSREAAVPQAVSPIPYTVAQRFPHDPAAFTQGLYFDDGMLFEGTGGYGASSLRRVDLETGRVLQHVPLAEQYFGEGIARFGDRIYQLTWQSETGFIYDRETFERTGQFRYRGEGWGLTADDRHLIMSDGSAFLRFIDPDSFAEVRRIEVRDAAGPVQRLNELEFIDGFIYANVWHTNRILRIAPEDGRVAGELDLTPLAAEAQPADPEGVLNGIAYDPETRRVFVTGKLWPAVFEIRIGE